MSRLGCACGHTIVDQTTPLAFKASFLTDSNGEEFFDWLVDETQSYVEAVQRDTVDVWLLDRGYGVDYVALKLSHGHVLHDHIHTRHLELKRDMYVCTKCGRVQIEHAQPNMFNSYSPDGPAEPNLFCKTPVTQPASETSSTSDAKSPNIGPVDED